MKLVILITFLVTVAVLVGCPAAEEDPTQGVRDTFEKYVSYIRDGEYDKGWTLFSIEYRENAAREFAEQKKYIRQSLAMKTSDVDKQAYGQTRMTAAQYLAAPPRKIIAAVLEVRRTDFVQARIVGKINIEGDIAYVRIAMPPDNQPADYQFIHRDGRWLFHARSYMPIR